MGASAVLLFAVPHGPLSQPWPLVGGHLISALVGVSCAKLIPHSAVAAAAAVSLAIASYGYIMENGKIVIDGPAEKLAANEDVQEFYLGVGGKEGAARSYRDIKHYKRRKRWLS